MSCHFSYLYCVLLIFVSGSQSVTAYKHAIWHIYKLSVLAFVSSVWYRHIVLHITVGTSPSPCNVWMHGAQGVWEGMITHWSTRVSGLTRLLTLDIWASTIDGGREAATKDLRKTKGWHRLYLHQWIILHLLSITMVAYMALLILFCRVSIRVGHKTFIKCNDDSNVKKKAVLDEVIHSNRRGSIQTNPKSQVACGLLLMMKRIFD